MFFKKGFKIVKHFDDFELSNMEGGKLLELLIDTKKEIVVHVNPDLGHIRVAARYLDIDIDKVDENSARHLVSALIEIEDKTIQNVMIGRSSLELGPHIKHSRTELTKAKKIIEKIMRLSRQLKEVSIIDNIKEHEYIFR